MARYLLTTQTLFDLARGENLPAERWIENASERDIYRDDLFISAATVGRCKRSIQIFLAKVADGSAGPGITRDYINTLDANLDHLIKTFRDDGRIVDADERIMTKWVDLLDDAELARRDGDELVPLESAERLELATAAAGRNGKRFILLSRRERFHERINGLVVEDPHDSFGRPDNAE